MQSISKSKTDNKVSCSIKSYLLLFKFTKFIQIILVKPHCKKMFKTYEFQCSILMGRAKTLNYLDESFIGLPAWLI